MDQSFLGSTWDHKNLLLGPTEDGKKEILKKCNFYDFSKLSIIEHKSGVRSGTQATEIQSWVCIRIKRITFFLTDLDQEEPPLFHTTPRKWLISY